MLYTEYQTAAEKHLNACKEALSLLRDKEKLDDNPAAPLNKAQEYLLMDIYYLSGYIFECCVNYGIFKRLYSETRTPIGDDVKSYKNFSESFAFYQQKKDEKKMFKFVVVGHDFWNNFDLLEQKTALPEIRSFKRNLPSDVRNLINPTATGWKPEKRYLIENPPLTFSQVEKLIACAEILFNLTKQIR